MCAHVIITAVHRLIGPMHINSLNCLPAGIHLESGPRLLRLSLQVPERNVRELFSGIISRGVEMSVRAKHRYSMLPTT